MSYQIYNPEPGSCTCYIGDPAAGALPLRVSMISAGGALLERCDSLRLHQFVYTTVKIEDGPSFALTGTVVSIEEGQPLIQWSHDGPSEAERIDAAIRELAARYADKRAPAAADGGSSREPAPSAGSATSASLSGSKRPSGSKGAGRRGASRAARPAAKPHDLVLSGKKLDLGATLLRKAKVVRSAELASRHQTVKVFDMKTIKELIKGAVNEAVAYLGSTLGDSERKRLLEEAEAEFKERLKLFEAEKAGLEEKTRVLQAELEKARAVLADERRREVSADRFTVSDAGMAELEQRLGRILDRSVRSGHAGPDLEAELRGVVARLLDDERGKIGEQAQRAQSETIALLEKKVGRLAASLESAEKERDRAQRRAHALETSGVVFRNTMEAGLDEDDPDREKKLALLKQIFDFNVEVRRELRAAGVVLPGRGQAGTPAVPIPEPPAASPPAAVETTPSDSAPRAEEDDAAIAASLGIKVKRPWRDARGADTNVIEKTEVAAPKGESSGLPPPEGTDPDDLPWEPPDGLADSVSRWKEVRSLQR